MNANSTAFIRKEERGDSDNVRRKLLTQGTPDTEGKPSTFVSVITWPGFQSSETIFIPLVY
jgi:hypothetical protein